MTANGRDVEVVLATAVLFDSGGMPNVALLPDQVHHYEGY